MNKSTRSRMRLKSSITVHLQESTTPSSHTPSRFTSSNIPPLLLGEEPRLRPKHSKSVNLLPLSSVILASAHRQKNPWAMCASYGKRIKRNGKVFLMRLGELQKKHAT